MADFKDEEIVDWRYEYLDEIETFSFDNILNFAPAKFSATIWFLFLGTATIVSIAASFFYKASSEWISSMCGNVAAGLIASVLILAYTTHKEKNLSYYDNFYLDLNHFFDKISLACNDLYWKRKEIQNNRDAFSPYDYDIFVTKLYLLHVTLTDIYLKIRMADKLNFNGFILPCDRIGAHKKEIRNLYENTSIICGNKTVPDKREFDKHLANIWNVELEIKHELRGYIKFVRDSKSQIRYGKSKKRTG